jgi:alanyl-tRNA synthetase
MPTFRLLAVTAVVLWAATQATQAWDESGHLKIAALAYEELSDAGRVAATLRVSDADLVESVERLSNERLDLEKEIGRLKSKLAQSNVGDLLEKARVVKGIKVLAAQVEGLDRTQMRSLADSLRDKLQSGVVLLGCAVDGNVALISAVTKDLAGKKVHAGKLVGAVAEEVGGKGGGRPDLAEAGGKNSGALPAALEKVYSLVEQMV